MRPAFAINDSGNAVRQNAEFRSNIALHNTSRVSFANRAHVLLAQLCGAACLAVCVCAHVNAIFGVFEGRTPNEIVTPAIGSDSVQVSAFHSVGTRPNESEQNKPMHSHRFVLARLGREIHRQIPALVDHWTLLLPSSGHVAARVEPTPNTAIVANSIAGEAGNVAVLNNVARMMLNHDLYSSYGLWPEPADVCASVRLASFYHQKQTCKSV